MKNKIITDKSSILSKKHYYSPYQEEKLAETASQTKQLIDLDVSNHKSQLFPFILLFSFIPLYLFFFVLI
jgi:hypothetical protein